MNRIVIHNCDYDPCSGGVKVLHYLASLVAATGTPVATTSSCFFNPTIPVVGSCDPGDIAVYPEIMGDNFLKANRCARYLLYHPRVNLPDGDCPILYMKEFLNSWTPKYKNLRAEDAVEVPNIEAADWCFPETKNIENLLFAGKRNCPEIPDVPFVEMPALNDPHRFRLRYACLALLRRSANLYTMDHFTVLEREAVLCGCRVWRVHGRKDFREVREDPEVRIMRPLRDRALGEKFVGIIRQFFNL